MSAVINRQRRLPHRYIRYEFHLCENEILGLVHMYIVNPKTRRKIKVGGPTYKRLEDDRKYGPVVKRLVEDAKKSTTKGKILPAKTSTLRSKTKVVGVCGRDLTNTVKFFASLSNTERRVLTKYTNATMKIDPHEMLNVVQRYLRTGKSDFSTVKIGRSVKSVTDVISIIDGIFSRAPRLTSDCMVYRGIGPASDESFVFYNLKPGDVYIDRGYLSTTIDKNVTERYGYRQFYIGDEDDVLRERLENRPDFLKSEVINLGLGNRPYFPKSDPSFNLDSYDLYEFNRGKRIPGKNKVQYTFSQPCCGMVIHLPVGQPYLDVSQLEGNRFAELDMEFLLPRNLKMEFIHKNGSDFYFKVV